MQQTVFVQVVSAGHWSSLQQAQCPNVPIHFITTLQNKHRASALSQQKVAGSPAFALTLMHVTPSKSTSCRVSRNCIRPGCNSPPGALDRTALPRCCTDWECSLTQPSELPENRSSWLTCGDPKPGNEDWLGDEVGKVCCGEMAHARHVIQARCALKPPICKAWHPNLSAASPEQAGT